MANDSPSNCKIKDDENNSSKKKLVNGKGSSTWGLGTIHTSGLRRLDRETSTRKQMTSCVSNMQKSEQLEKRTPTTQVVKKSERFGKQRMPSLLRRPDRSKKHTSSSSSGSKKCEKGNDSVDMKLKKGNREKSVKWSIVEARGVSRSERHDLKPVVRKRMRMDARAYKALFKVQRRRVTAADAYEELERPDKLSHKDSSSSGASRSMQLDDREEGGDECSGRMGEELRRVCVDRGSEGALGRSNSSLRNGDGGINASKSGVIVEETLGNGQRVLLDCSVEENLRTPELVGYASVGRSLGGGIDLESDDKARPSKRKRYTMDMDSDASATVASKDICTSVSNAVSSSLSGCKRHDIIETCAACSKGQRVDPDSQKQDLFSCNTTFNKDVCDISIPECCVAASTMKQKIDRKESLTLSKQYLNFSCKEEEEKSVYSKQPKIFLSRSENIKGSEFSKGSMSAAEDITKEPLEQEQTPNYKMASEEIPKSIKRIKRKCEKRMIKLLQKQQLEIQEFHRIWEEKRVHLEKEHREKSALVRSTNSHNPVRPKILDNKYGKKMEEHQRQKDICLKDLMSKQLGARYDERQKAAHWLAEAKSSSSENRAHDELPLHGSECCNRGYSQASGHGAHNDPENVAPMSGHLMEEQSPGGIVHKMHVSGVPPADTLETLTEGTVGCSDRTKIVWLLVNPNSANESATMVSGKTSDARMEQPNRLDSSGDGSENIVFRSQHYSGIQLSHGILSSTQGEGIPSELPETVANEVVGGLGSVDLGTSAVESNGQNDRRDAVSSDKSNAVENQMNGSKISVGGDSASTEPSLLILPSVQPVFSLVCNCSSPQNLIEYSQSLASTEMQDEYAPIQGNQNSMQRDEVPPLQHVDAWPTDQLNHEAPLVERLEQLRPNLSSNLPLDHNQPDLPPATGLAHEPCNALLSTEAPPQLAKDPTGLSDLVFSQTGADLELHLPSDTTEITLGHNQRDLCSPSRVGHQPSRELYASFQNAEAPGQVAEDTAELPNQVVLQAGANLSIIQGSNNLPLHTEHQVASRTSTLPLYGNPLQNELERIRRDTEQAVKVHEDMKQQLKSECEKEMQEVIAQIRSKYEAKLQDAEAAIMLRKNELDSNYNKVLMNKILANIFKSKCLDISPSGFLGMPQVAPPGLMQLHQSPLQPAPRPTPFTGSSLAGQPAASQEITAPPLQIVHQPAALFSSISLRPPNIDPIIPPARNIRVGGEIRAPAPHIQPFRPASMSAARVMSLPLLIPNQPAPSSLNGISPSFPQPPLRPSPPPRIPPFPINYSGLYNRPPQPESAGGLPTPENSALSMLDLLMDINNRSSARWPNILPPLPDLGSNFDLLDLSVFGTTGSVQVSSSPSAVATHVVCLSDDD